MGTLKDALKKWFYTNNSSAASSDARVALMDSSGNPKGSDTMANLAIVLGGIWGSNINATTDNIDANAFENHKVYAILSTSAGTLNHPNINKNSIIVTIPFVMAESSKFKLQFGLTDDGSTWLTRMCWNGTWGNWYKHTGTALT